MTTSIQWQRIEGKWEAVGMQVNVPDMKNQIKSMTTVGIKQLCQQHLTEDIESKIALFAWKHAKIPNMPVLQVFAGGKPPRLWEHGPNSFCIETLSTGPKILWPRFIGRGKMKRPYTKKTSDKLRSRDVVIHTLGEDMVVSAEMGRHKVAQLIKDAILEDATRFVEVNPRTWRRSTKEFWSPEIFNDLVGVLLRNKERQNRREFMQMFRLR